VRTARAAAAVAVALTGVAVWAAAPARAGLCDYPGVGVGANIFGIRGYFCDFPTEINGSHWHCEAGNASIGGVFGTTIGDIGTVGVAGGGVGGSSCTWRCPDNTMAPAPNPPGEWKSYLTPHANACKDHMDPNGFWSEPVHPDEGLPPPGGTPPPPPPPTAPGEPNP
jgi:hypothetical protein